MPVPLSVYTQTIYYTPKYIHYMVYLGIIDLQDHVAGLFLIYLEILCVSIHHLESQYKLKKDLDDFAVYINQFAGVYNDLCFMQELSKNDAELTEIFANDIYFGDDKNLWINGKTLYNATIELGNRLVLVLQGGYKFLAPMNKMEKYKNHWEHQGYPKETLRKKNK